MGRPPKKEKTEPIRLPESVVKRIRRIAIHRGIDPGDYVADRFGKILDDDEKEMLKEITEERRKNGEK